MDDKNTLLIKIARVGRSQEKPIAEKGETGNDPGEGVQP